MCVCASIRAYAHVCVCVRMSERGYGCSRRSHQRMQILSEC